MMPIKYIIAIIIIFIVSPFAFADPLIRRISDRTPSHGQVITISGSDFGSHADYNTKEDYLLHVWEDVEHGGGYIPNGNDTWIDKSFGGRLNSTGNRMGSSYNIRHERQSSTTYTNAMGQSVTSNYQYGMPLKWSYSNKIIFLSGWYYLNDSTEFNATSNNQSKIIGTADIDSDKLYAGISSYYGGPKSGWKIAFQKGYHSLFRLFGSVWSKLDYYFDATTGEVVFWLNGKKLSRTDSNEGIDRATFLMYMRNDNKDGWFILSDDHYADRTQARVFISDQKAYDDSDEHLQEMQIPLSWSFDSIQIKFNKGAFSDNETVYLYVIDSNGKVSNGWKISIS